jgi:hypothetical protein
LFQHAPPPSFLQIDLPVTRHDDLRRAAQRIRCDAHAADDQPDRKHASHRQQRLRFAKAHSGDSGNCHVQCVDETHAFQQPVAADADDQQADQRQQRDRETARDMPSGAAEPIG